jgi:bisphosphoglycerate-independent phosphoglycerate mutase (AlkP superfamily)
MCLSVCVHQFVSLSHSITHTLAQPLPLCALAWLQVAAGVATERYALVVCNFAPPDMVGHTGMYDAAVQAVAATDAAIGTVAAACAKHNTVLFVTADHGNAEQMIATGGGGPHTAHTCNPGARARRTGSHTANSRTPMASSSHLCVCVCVCTCACVCMYGSGQCRL